MRMAEIVRDSFERGFSVRRFPGGERVIVHRWPAKRMHNTEGMVYDLIARNITATNALFSRLQKRG